MSATEETPSAPVASTPMPLESLTAVSSSPLRYDIAYDPVRLDFAITDDELSQLTSDGAGPSKELFFFLISLVLSCGLNSLSDFQNYRPSVGGFPVSATFVINFGIAFISLVLSIYFGVCWRRESTKKKQIVERIKNKPRFTLGAGDLRSV